MASLESTLEKLTHKNKQAEKIRRYIVVEAIYQVLKEDSVFIVSTKRSVLDKCRLPVGIRLFVSAGHSESDIHKVCDSLTRVAALVLV
ncbi:hypothetical protein GW17_00024462 [Ensete ventricosum]|nr:hypothetical protein GW17_00024462 [Ensete ventricosum]